VTRLVTFANVLMTLFLGSADSIMSFDWLHWLFLNLFWLFQDCGLFNRPTFCTLIKLLQALACNTRFLESRSQRSRLDLEGSRSRALSLETLHRLFL